MGLPVLGAVDPYATTDMSRDDMAPLLADIWEALPFATPGAELRGLQRLRVMAELCAHSSGAVLRWIAD
ncbi:hypothetical protein [Pedococcus sp. 5OH_020]|uniref:hypothetical protein n=1 Tax=Pedococcus sp. 5OH_020 TaxID=2989814 RepID=UPI0022E9FBE2|nr:hypothetical protein [Pedococcus sp. 5OH_020]